MKQYGYETGKYNEIIGRRNANRKKTSVDSSEKG